MNTLQKTLLLNAIFSGISGVLLLIFSSTISDIFSVNAPKVFWITGVLLLYFAGTIVYQIFKQRPLGVWIIIVQDFLWVIGSIVLLVLDLFDISEVGRYMLGVVALVVLLIAINQLKALMRISQSR